MEFWYQTFLGLWKLKCQLHSNVKSNLLTRKRTTKLFLVSGPLLSARHIMAIYQLVLANLFLHPFQYLYSKFLSWNTFEATEPNSGSTWLQWIFRFWGNISFISKFHQITLYFSDFNCISSSSFINSRFLSQLNILATDIRVVFWK